jgi:hypothetical protein
MTTEFPLTWKDSPIPFDLKPICSRLKEARVSVALQASRDTEREFIEEITSLIPDFFA